MLTRVSCVLSICILCGVTIAQVPEYVIYQHNIFYNDPVDPNLPNPYYYEIDPVNKWVTIHHAVAGEVFEFEAVVWNDGAYIRPGNMNLITADEDAGPVAIAVIGNINQQHGEPYGARHIQALTLDADGVTGVIQELKIDGTLGTTATTDVDAIAGACETLGIGRPLEVGTLSGSFASPQAFLTQHVTIQTLSGSLSAVGLSDVTIGTLSGDVVTEGATGAISIGTLSGTFDGGSNNTHILDGPISIDTLEGTFDVGVVSAPLEIGTMNGGTLNMLGLDEYDPTADITITGVGPHSGSVDSLWTLEAAHNSITINGSFGGPILLGNCTSCTLFGLLDVSGNAEAISLGGFVGATGLVYIGGNLLGRLGVGNDMAGTIHIGGDVTADGRLELADTIRATGSLSIDGNVSADVNDEPRITIGKQDLYDMEGSIRLGASDQVFDGTCAIDGAVTADASVEVNGEIGSNGSIEFGSDVAGTLSVTGRTAGEISIAGGVPAGGSVTLGGYNGQVSIGTDVAGRVSVTGSLDGELTVSGKVADTGEVNIDGGIDRAGQVSVAGNLEGSLDVGDDVAAAESPRIFIGNDVYTGADVTVAGNLAGGIEIGRHLMGTALATGEVHVHGDILYGGSITIGGDLRGLVATHTLGEWRGDLAGFVHVGGNMSGQMDITGRLGDVTLAGDFGGHVRVNGAFAPVFGQSPQPPAPLIHIHENFVAEEAGSIGPTSYIAFDYDGYHSGDIWDVSASVIIVDPEDPIRGNSPEQHVWATTSPRGDMNNNAGPEDEFPGFDDINPFVSALTEPATFEVDFPGLSEFDSNSAEFVSGNVIYHGDCNCSGEFGFDDINAFVALVSTHTVDPGCLGEGAGAGAPAPPSIPAVVVAQKLEARIAPSLKSGLLTVIAEAIKQYEQPAMRAYWQTVRTELTK